MAFEYYIEHFRICEKKETKKKRKSRQDWGNEEKWEESKKTKSAVGDNMRSGEKEIEEKVKKKMLFEWKQDFAK